MTACSFFDMDTDEPILIAGDSKLENLRELTKPVLSYSKETEGIFIRLPNLQRLTLSLKESWDYTTEQYWFPKLDHLTKLDYLRVDFESSNTNDSGPSIATNWSWDFHFPSDLKLLSLWHFIARLSNLKELLVIRTIMQGEEWNMGEEDTFVNLKFLFLDEVTLAKWLFGEKSFPVLEKLVLSGCHKLEEIPSSFGDICSLKIIQLVNSPQLEDSAKKIKQYFEDMGGDELQVLKTLKGREGKVTLEQSWKEEKRMKETERRRKQTTHRSFPNLKPALEFIRSFFLNFEQGLYKDLWARIFDVAYEAKAVIDSIIARDNGLLHLIFSLPITIKKIKHIKEEVSNISEKIPKNSSLTVANSTKKPVERKSLTTDKMIVGFKEETNWLITKLTCGPKDLDVISITGMPGSGKTTLAYKVYSDESVCSHFDLRAWCTVDQEYDETKLLVKIFNQVTSSDLKFSEEIDVADKLRKQLYGKRYLIVLDDVWDTTTWDDLTRPLPEVEKGSRIILTTRQKEVAFHGKGNTDPLNLRLLSPEESWELIEKRAFGDQSCPDELLEVGKEIAENCKGLPLVADLIAGVIAAREKTKSAWLEVQNNLSSFILSSEVDVMKVIELSYDHLPHHLKPSFLFLASWPKDTIMEMDVVKILWRTEGFVEQTEMMNVEEAMEIYLDNLFSSSLVIAFNEIGNLPTFQIHDLVHDFCLIKARQEKLFGRISSSDPSSSTDLMPRIVTIVYDKENFGPNNFVLLDTKMKRHSGKHLYSLEIKGDEMEDGLSDACHLRDLRLLRVLVLYPSFMMVKDSLLNEICMLNHLRFLKIGTEVKSLPSSFSNLWNLEVLFVDNGRSTMVLLPRIWDLVKLRGLVMNASSFFDLDTDEPILIAEDSKLENLRELETLVLSYSKETEDIFKRFPNLQTLVFDLKESWDYLTVQLHSARIPYVKGNVIWPLLNLSSIS
ncbi:hypothetical protein BC332_14789 [Capsicum chinense]|nr:hypothetical protein BC332_14789 [Capsicum chinense]